MSLVTRGLDGENLLVTGGLGIGVLTAVLICPVDQVTAVREILQELGVDEGQSVLTIHDDQEIALLEVMFDQANVDFPQFIDQDNRYYSIETEEGLLNITVGRLDQIIELVDFMQSIDAVEYTLDIVVIPLESPIEFKEVIDKVR